MRFEDRRQAGQLLADKLLLLESEGALHLNDGLSDAIVVALPRGGVPVGLEIAQALHVPLDVCVVRKVGMPFQSELAVAAVAEGDELVVNEEVRRYLDMSRDEIERLAEPKRAEVQQRVDKFRNGRPPIDVAGKTVILVDDGLATGATAMAAVHVLRKRKADKIILALPVCAYDSVAQFQHEVDDFVVLATPACFFAVGQFYRDFKQVSDHEVKYILQQASEVLHAKSGMEGVERGKKDGMDKWSEFDWR
jgi:putative phosphoribosyl transferase